MPEALIISGGAYAPLPEPVQPSFVIACDRGYLHAQRMGIQPDLIVGDFDSSPVPEADVPVERFPAHKDDTDTLLAVRRALQRGYRDIAIACAFGGRLDHTFANLQCAAFIAQQGGTARLYGESTIAVVYTGGARSFPIREGWSLSVFSLSDQCTGVSISGAEYEGHDLTITNRFPIGVSNAWREDAVDVEVKDGIVMVMVCRIERD